MNITDHMELVKQQLEKLPCRPIIKLFAGQLQVEDLKDMKMDGVRPYILLSCVGCNFPARKDRIRLEGDALFGAWVIGKVDKDSIGMSSIASNTACEISRFIESYSGDISKNTKIPALVSMNESFNGQKDKANYSAWSVIWAQRIVLD
jgi:hypothetical protein